MNAIFRAAREIEEFCRARAWGFCIIGGLAVQRWGEPRLTRDVGVTLLTGFGNEPAFVDELLRGFRGRLPDSSEFALANRVLLVVSTDGIPIDIALGAMPFEEAAVRRATPYEVAPNVELTTCSAEDLVVLKAFAGRDRDWVDVEGIVNRQGSRLDDTLVWRELLPLLELKEDRDAEPRLRRILGGR